ncbi:MAG TPA: hypothetical protein VFO38_02860 [Candidatus Saccharimonadales bacterium]|nr:hypothetical protein [Candidatus Saccharimonadales bacterium]
MQPELPQPIFTQPAVEPPRKSHKKLVIIIASVLVLLAGGLGVYFWLNSSKPAANSDQNQSLPPKAVAFGSSKDAVSYAGNKVYDACNMLPISILNQHVEKFSLVADSLGGGSKPDKPLMIDHGYIDRTVPAVQGKDAVPREPGMAISETGTDASIRAHSFMSIADSYCFYGQGVNFNSSLAKVYVLQPPVPVPPKLTTYLEELKQKGGLAAESQGVQVYVETVKPGDSDVVVMFKKGNTIVFLASVNEGLLKASTDAIVGVLAKEPTGPMTATYPDQYKGLGNPCELFTADEFQRVLGRPASAVTLETLALNEIEANTAQRECRRYEVERIREGEITTSTVTLAQSRTEQQAKDRMAALKTKQDIKTQDLSGLGDEAFAAVDGQHKFIIVRVGKQTAKIVTDGETKDANLDAFIARTQSVAKIVVPRLK